MKWIPVVSVCVTVAGGLTVAGAQTKEVPRSVDDLVSTALQRNGDYLALQQSIPEARGMLRQAAVRPSSTIEIDGAVGKLLGSPGESEYSAGISRTIETGGKRGRRMDVARIGVEIALAELRDRERQIRFEIQSRYSEAAAAKERIATVDKILELNRESLRLTDARVEKGDAAPLERQLLSVELKRIEAQRAAMQGKRTAALLELKRIAGLSPDESMEIDSSFDGSEVAPVRDDLKKRAVSNRPDLLGMELISRQAGAEVNLARANASPDITLSAKYSRRSSQFGALGISPAGGTVPLQEQSNLLAFGASIPIFTKNRTKGEVEAATARQTAAKLRHDFLLKSIASEVDTAYARWEAARTTRETLRTGVLDQSAGNVAVIQQAYRLGQMRLLDVLNEQRRLLDSQLAFIDATADQAQAFAELQRAVGGDVR